MAGEDKYHNERPPSGSDAHDGAVDDPRLAVDFSKFSSREVEWYTKLQKKLGLPSWQDALPYQMSMYMVRSFIWRYPKEVRLTLFGKEKPENREFLLGLLERIVAGENLPDFNL